MSGGERQRRYPNRVGHCPLAALHQGSGLLPTAITNKSEAAPAIGVLLAAIVIICTRATA
jgi:hypothetical protein